MSRMDILQGWYWFLTDYHGGQYCPLYQRLTRLSDIYTPAYRESPRDLTGDAREVYEYNVSRIHANSDRAIEWPDYHDQY